MPGQGPQLAPTLARPVLLPLTTIAEEVVLQFIFLHIADVRHTTFGTHLGDMRPIVGHTTL